MIDYNDDLMTAFEYTYTLNPQFVRKYKTTREAEEKREKELLAAEEKIMGKRDRELQDIYKKFKRL